MGIKLIMRWDIKPETESEYFEFLVHEFIPALNKLGVEDILVWYTAYGNCEQKLAEGIIPSKEKLREVLASEEWIRLTDRLETFVVDFDMKAIQASKGFQI